MNWFNLLAINIMIALVTGYFLSSYPCLCYLAGALCMAWNVMISKIILDSSK